MYKLEENSYENNSLIQVFAENLNKCEIINGFELKNLLESYKNVSNN